MYHTSRAAGAALACTLVLFTACGPAIDEAELGVQPAPVTAAQADLWATSNVAFEGGVTSAQLALEHTEDAAVRAYAQQLAEDYGGVRERFTGLTTRFNLDATPGEGAQRLQETQRQTADRLAGFHGPDFDRQWIDYQIATHRWMLDTIDRSYLPAARGRVELETELRTTRELIQRHLEEAERIKAGWQ